jgi:hypothetical protein
MVDPEIGSERARPRSGAGSAAEPKAARAMDWRGAVVAALPLMVLAFVATAYGFLEGKGNHPSLKLGGALVVAGLAPITLLLARSTLRRHRPSLRAIRSARGVAADRREFVLMLLVFLSVAAALVHFAVIEQHFTEYWLYGAFFVAVGLFELAWAVLVMTAPSRFLYAAGAAINALTVAAYAVTRTVGLLVGPAAHETEKIGFGDLTATVFEIMLVIGSILLLFRSWGRTTVRPATSEALIGTAAVIVVAPTILALFSTVGGSPFVAPAG